jgi:DedD protein
MPAATQPDRTPSAATEPVAAAPTPVAVQPVEPVQDTVPAAAPAEGGAFLVQVGAFGSADAARKLVAELRSAGYSAEVAPITRNGKTLHRVRVGPEADKAGAEQLARRLKDRGLPATIVQND